MIKAVAFDFCGTLTKYGQNTWRRTWELLGDTEYDDFLFSSHRENKISQEEWGNLICKRWRKHKVTANTFRTVGESLTLLHGTSETLKTLHKHGIKVFIISCGIKQVIEIVLKLKSLSKFVTAIEAYELIFNDKGELAGMKMPREDLEHAKNRYLEIVMKSNNLNANEILFVGNDKNDENAARSGVTMLCINPLDTDINDKHIWHHGIKNCNDLREVLKYVNLK